MWLPLCTSLVHPYFADIPLVYTYHYHKFLSGSASGVALKIVATCFRIIYILPLIAEDTCFSSKDLLSNDGIICHEGSVCVNMCL